MAWQAVEKRPRAVFQPRQTQRRAPRGSQNNDLRRYFDVASMRLGSLSENQQAARAARWQYLPVQSVPLFPG